MGLIEYRSQGIGYNQLLNRGVKDHLIEKVTFEQKSEGRWKHADMQGEVILSRGYKKYRSPETNHVSCAGGTCK